MTTFDQVRRALDDLSGAAASRLRAAIAAFPVRTWCGG